MEEAQGTTAAGPAEVPEGGKESSPKQQPLRTHWADEESSSDGAPLQRKGGKVLEDCQGGPSPASRSDVRHSPTPHVKVRVPQELLARVVGFRGKEIDSVLHETRAGITIDKKNREGCSTLLIYGKDTEAVKAAEGLLRDKVELAARGTEDGSSTGAAPLARKHKPGMTGPAAAGAASSWEVPAEREDPWQVQDPWSSAATRDASRAAGTGKPTKQKEGEESEGEEMHGEFQEWKGKASSLPHLKPPKEEPETDKITLQVRIPQDFVGCVIRGHGGAFHIKTVAERTCTRLTMDQRTRHEGHSFLYIQGSDKDCHWARAIIENRMREVHRKKEKRQADERWEQQREEWKDWKPSAEKEKPREELWEERSRDKQSPSWEKGHRWDEQRWEERPPCSWEDKQKSWDKKPWEEERSSWAEGSKRQAEESKWRDWDESKDSHWELVKVSIPQRFVGTLVGSGGNKIRDMEQRSRAKLTLDQNTREEGYSLLRIQGWNQDVQKAKDMVRNHLLQSGDAESQERRSSEDRRSHQRRPGRVRYSELRSSSEGSRSEASDADGPRPPLRVIRGGSGSKECSGDKPGDVQGPASMSGGGLQSPYLPPRPTTFAPGDKRRSKHEGVGGMGHILKAQARAGAEQGRWRDASAVPTEALKLALAGLLGRWFQESSDCTWTWTHEVTMAGTAGAQLLCRSTRVVDGKERDSKELPIRYLGGDISLGHEGVVLNFATDTRAFWVDGAKPNETIVWCKSKLSQLVPPGLKAGSSSGGPILLQPQPANLFQKRAEGPATLGLSRIRHLDSSGDFDSDELPFQ